MSDKSKKKFQKKGWHWLIAIAIIVGITSTGCAKNKTKVEANAKVVAETTTTTENIAVNTSKTEVIGELKVHYINVGQADSILIQQGSNSMLIDAGNNSDDKLVVDYLKKQGVEKIDVLIGTHTDEDHIGGLDTVIKTFDIGKIYMPKVTKTTDTYKDVVTAIKAKNMKVSAPKVGETFKIGNSECTIIAPNAETYDNSNNYSIVTKLKYGNNSFIFMGDAESISEGQILQKQLDISADVIKIGHHGSKTSTGQKFLEKVNPKFAVISCGKGNSYGHPQQETMTLLKSKNIPVYRTDEVGTIIVTSNGKTITFDKKVGSYNIGSIIKKPIPIIKKPIIKKAVPIIKKPITKESVTVTKKPITKESVTVTKKPIVVDKKVVSKPKKKHM
ncbi:ComEC/Rec2 family competence protein [Clostridium sp. FP1]|uniref:ComEC/Rec2 family competence protein n=1 Tax=Clostridium sp. FP1 TaxID=2724076 RepID=UPI0013E9023B|nr:ComEC/Rec2 family competence protein [Clostridium sp. FP1]MBZ9633100.1 MBL fold metallo-hydrolase [Clostridium sp. FP1]